MNKLKEWWSKRWMKNLLFAVVLVVLFLTDVGQWVRIQFAQLTLRNPSNEVVEGQGAEGVFDFPFEVKTGTGKTFLFEEFRGKPTFINFWASWCVPCLSEFSSLEKLQEQLPEVRFVFLTAEDQEAFDKYVSNTRHSSLDFYKQISRTPTQLAHQAIPASFLVNAEGKVVFQHIGAADWSDDEVVESLKASLK